MSSRTIPVQEIAGRRLELLAGAPCLGGPANVYSLLADGGFIRELVFQTKDPATGIDGFTNEALLAVLKDRFEGFQAGPFANVFNARALEGLELAQAAMNERVADRQARGVLGTQTA